MALWCEQAWLAEGWRNDVRLSLDNGRISSIEIGVDAAPGDERIDRALEELDFQTKSLRLLGTYPQARLRP